jgi:hypothetical protein
MNYMARKNLERFHKAMRECRFRGVVNEIEGAKAKQQAEIRTRLCAEIKAKILARQTK